MSYRCIEWRVIFIALLICLTTPLLTSAQDTSQTSPTAPYVTAPSAPQAPAPSATTPQAKIDKGDTAWMLTSSALVLMMTIPGLFLFYGGLVRRKNVLGTIMHSFIIVAVITIQWALWGYSLAFAPDIGGGWLGGLEWFGLRGVGPEPNADYAATIPHAAFMI